MKRKRKGDWVIVGGAIGEQAHCTRCGEGLKLPTPIRMEIFIAASKAFVKCHERCEDVGYRESEPNSLTEWVCGRDTGVSSCSIYAAFTNDFSCLTRGRKGIDTPHDPEDFGRCHRLIEKFPQVRAGLAQLESISPKWKPFTEAWDELTKMYQEALVLGEGSEMYQRMKELEAAGVQGEKKP